MGIRQFLSKSSNKDGHWITVHGRHIFIKDRKTLSEAEQKPRPLPETVQMTLSRIEEDIRYRPSGEIGNVVNMDGVHVWQQQGESDHVDLSDAIQKGLVSGNVVTHNHPKDRSFSPSDIIVMLANRAKEMRAAGPRHLYRIQPPDGLEYTQKEFEKILYVIKHVEHELDMELTKNQMSASLTEDEANQIFYHELWVSVSKITGLRYERKMNVEKSLGRNGDKRTSRVNGAFSRKDSNIRRPGTIQAKVHQSEHRGRQETAERINKSSTRREPNGVSAFLISQNEVTNMPGIRDYIDKTPESGIRSLLKSRTKSEWQSVKRDKAGEYGNDETFADEKHDSYPLTKDGKPSRERTIAAWDYIHTRKDGDEYTAEERARIESHIRAFAKKHFGEELQKSGVKEFAKATDDSGIRGFAKAKKAHMHAYATKHRDPIFIPLNRLDTLYQTEKALDEGKIRENVRRMKNKEPLEPVVVGYGSGEKDGSRADVLDGHHRLEAAKRIGYTHVPCVVKGNNEKRVTAADKRYREVWKSRESTNPPPAVPKDNDENVASDYGAGGL